jgi:hypothetical protein
MEDLRSHLGILKESMPAICQTILSFEKYSVQVLFSPSNAVADLERKVKDLWNIPEKMYHLLANGAHEAIPATSWPELSMVRAKIGGNVGSNPPAKKTKIHLKTKTSQKISVVEVLDDLALEDVAILVEDIFEDDSDIKLYQEGGLLDLADSIRDWTSSTGEKAQITPSPDVTFNEDEELEQIPVMEVWYDEMSRCVKDTPGLEEIGFRILRSKRKSLAFKER